MRRTAVIRPSRAFTLIELLVVVAIIALLISILLPSLSRAREQAYQVKCMSHLNAMFKGIFYYGQDLGHNGYLPQFNGVLVEDYPPGTGYWVEQILKYVEVRRSKVGSRSGFFRCPADENPHYIIIQGTSRQRAGTAATEEEKRKADFAPTTTTDRRGNVTRVEAPWIEPISYTTSCDSNQNVIWPGVGAADTPRKLDDIERPHCFPLIGETTVANSSRGGCFRWADMTAQALSPAFASVYLRHYGGDNPQNNGTNWLFADGHAQWHSARYNAEQLLCCIDLGDDRNRAFDNAYSARQKQRDLCTSN